jgi:formate dehydrogenase major subunit
MMGRGAMSNSIAELEDAPLILAAGTNTTESHPVIALRLKAAVRKGGRLIVVDPRRIELTGWAHRWLRLKLGTDIALYNAMAHVIISEGLVDEAFVAARTTGFEELRDFVQRYTPQRAEALCGVPAAEIVAAARAYATAPRAAIVYTLGITEHSCGVHNVQTLANLALLTGNLGLASAGINPLRGQNNVQGAGDMGCLPSSYPGYQKVGDPAARAVWEQAWGAPLSPRPGITKITAVEEILKGRVKALFIMGENTAVSDANAGKTRQALEAVDFLVVQEIFPNETTRHADVVLPAASFAEEDGTFTNSERRVQRVRRAVAPPGQAKEDWLILTELAARLGAPMGYSNPAEIWDEVARSTPFLRGIDYERIDDVGIQWPCPDGAHEGTRFLHEESFVSGKGCFQAIPHVEMAEPPDQRYPLILTTGRRRSTYHTGTQTGRAGGFETLVPHERLEMSPADAAELGLTDGEPVRLTSRRGSLEVPVQITDRSPPGVVFMSFHFPGQAPTNLLTTDACDPITETPAFKACAVRVDRLPTEP